VLEPEDSAVSNTAVREDVWVRIPPAAPIAAILDIDCRATPTDLSLCLDRQNIAGPHAYLLGLYLGDGMLSPAPRRVWRLRIVLDQSYPSIIERCKWAIHQVSWHVPGTVRKLGCIEVYSNWKHWICAFPQHGPGPKHRRHIELATWQQQVVNAHPHEFLRGLVHSDGCRSLNRVRRPLKAGVREYEYPRYFFSNHSAGIRRLFTETCALIGVETKPDGPYNISVARRASVELLDSFIGPKR
jgi:hypothetical protein